MMNNMDMATTMANSGGGSGNMNDINSTLNAMDMDMDLDIKSFTNHHGARESMSIMGRDSSSFHYYDPNSAYASYNRNGYEENDDDHDDENEPATTTMGNLAYGRGRGRNSYGSFVSDGSYSPYSSPPQARKALSFAGSQWPNVNANRKQSSSTKSVSKSKPKSLSTDDVQMQLLQEEVGCLNDLGCRLFDEGHLHQSVVHFHNGLDRIKTLKFLKSQQESRKDQAKQKANKKKKGKQSQTTNKSQDFWLKACCLGGDNKKQDEDDEEDDQEQDDEEQPEVDAGPEMTAPKRPGSLLLPVDTTCHVWSTNTHWETITSIVLMHNASMVHFKAHSYGHAKKLLDLARGLLKTSLTSENQNGVKALPSSLHSLMDTNKYVVYVVVSLYIAFGRVLLKLPSTSSKYKKSQCQARAKQVYQMAATLLKRYKQLQEDEKYQNTRRSMGIGVGGMGMDMGMGVGVANHGRNMHMHMNMAMSRSMEENLNTMNSMSAAFGLSGINMNIPSLPMNSMSAALGMALPTSSSSNINNHINKNKPSRRISSQQHDYELDLDTLAPAPSSDSTDGVDVGAGVYDPMEAIMSHTHKKRPAPANADAPEPHHGSANRRKKTKVDVNVDIDTDAFTTAIDAATRGSNARRMAVSDSDRDCELALPPPPSMPRSIRDSASEASTTHRYLVEAQDHDSLKSPIIMMGQGRTGMEQEHEQGQRNEQEHEHEREHDTSYMKANDNHNEEKKAQERAEPSATDADADLQDVEQAMEPPQPDASLRNMEHASLSNMGANNTSIC
jgi:hypothetical protein